VLNPETGNKLRTWTRNLLPLVEPSPEIISGDELPEAQGKRQRLLHSPAAGGADVIEGDGATAEKNKGECKCGKSQGEFVSAVAHHPIVEVHFGNGDGQIDADGKSSHAREQAYENEQAAKEFGEGGEIGGPARESEAGDEVSVVVKAAEDLVVSVANDDSTKS
jgi:hypothetical protein